MNKHALPFIVLVALWPATAQAQVGLRIELGLPIAPPLVVIQPGIQVVEGFGEEVFFHRGWYWCRRPGGWYRARSPRDRFEWIEARRVPGVLIRVPEGRYRNWRHDGRPMERREAHERRDERREEHRGERRDEGHDRERHDRDRHEDDRRR